MYTILDIVPSINGQELKLRGGGGGVCILVVCEEEIIIYEIVE